MQDLKIVSTLNDLLADSLNYPHDKQIVSVYDYN